MSHNDVRDLAVSLQKPGMTASEHENDERLRMISSVTTGLIIARGIRDAATGLCVWREVEDLLDAETPACPGQ